MTHSHSSEISGGASGLHLPAQRKADAEFIVLARNAYSM